MAFLFLLIDGWFWYLIIIGVISNAPLGCLNEANHAPVPRDISAQITRFWHTYLPPKLRQWESGTTYSLKSLNVKFNMGRSQNPSQTLEFLIPRWSTATLNLWVGEVTYRCTTTWLIYISHLSKMMKTFKRWKNWYRYSHDSTGSSPLYINRRGTKNYLRIMHRSC